MESLRFALILSPTAMKIHEYQAKEILRGFGVATPRGRVTDSPEEAGRIAKEFGGRAVVKAQVHAGGRGKGGGVKLAKTPDEAVELAKKIIGMQLVTHQTGPTGQRVKKILVEEALDIARELYIGITLDLSLIHISEPTRQAEISYAVFC